MPIMINFRLRFIKGKPFIVDPGTGVYSSDAEMRMKFRSTAMHNTLSIDGYEQNVIAPPKKMLFKMKNHSHAEGQITGNGHFIGQQFGYPQPHTRLVTPHPGERIMICDRLKLEMPKEIHFHLHPSLSRVEQVSPNCWALSDGVHTLNLQTFSDCQSFLRDYPFSPVYVVFEKGMEIVFSTQQAQMEFTLKYLS